VPRIVVASTVILSTVVVPLTVIAPPAVVASPIVVISSAVVIAIVVISPAIVTVRLLLADVVSGRNAGLHGTLHQMSPTCEWMSKKGCLDVRNG
jgi:hypothetical protein